MVWSQGEKSHVLEESDDCVDPLLKCDFYLIKETREDFAPQI